VVDRGRVQNRDEEPAKGKAVRDELVDVFYYLLRLADVLDVDLGKAFMEKIRHNHAKHPVKRARGNTKKYSDLQVSKGLNPR